MTKVSIQLANVRRARRLPATRVSRRSGFDVSGIYAIENGRRDPRESTLDAIANAIGTTVLVVDTDHRGTVSDAANEIRELVADGDDVAAAQVLVQVATNLRTLDVFPALAVSYEAPSTIDEKWDAALAGVVETTLSERGLAAPAWAADVTGDPTTRWDPWTGGTVPVNGDDVPEPLRRRGVWIESGELSSV